MASQNQDRLRTHFADAPVSSHNDRWDDLWKEGTFLPWDRGYANPALIDLLQRRPSTSPDANPSPGAPPSNGSGADNYTSIPSTIKADGTRCRVLIPGCGKGYDIVLFAAHGYDAYGLEVSSHAANAAKKYIDAIQKSEGLDSKDREGPLEGEYLAASSSHKVGYGSMNVLLGDYFSDEWLKEVQGWNLGEGFDIIYDNTFLCALPPFLRPKWASRTVSLLRHRTDLNTTQPSPSEDALLVCLEFPTHKPAASAGPPWSLPPTVHAELLKQPGEEISYDDKGVVVETDRPDADNALVRVAHYTPRRTHTVGVVNGIVRDCVSLWRHKSEV
ncbi:S-adenosyl-L-methionine-dependent methyltransferase [Cucurbitaria berberidis CBS 394.84]|uniref:S-adenosyl-L-methionine-dependent methyltransferase n=1 Tax=Cucurbitaria berberidis CBS 394.84 TaxID=1168544 RepID=A0A9P4GPV3_9PLEO|nr:S-adenosyl-L-methionine-dependent methyltransferase [Cucurbitaria berberidis CBS 394.84]KAF1849025.1 S-adenosyl-L-methionine-dependent methyltransferase [Cucurbitaria berberidis CBS 394.84]